MPNENDLNDENVVVNVCHQDHENESNIENVSMNLCHHDREYYTSISTAQQRKRSNVER